MVALALASTFLLWKIYVPTTDYQKSRNFIGKLRAAVW